MSYFIGMDSWNEVWRKEDETARRMERIDWEREHCPPMDDGVKDEPKDERKEPNEH